MIIEEFNVSVQTSRL